MMRKDIITGAAVAAFALIVPLGVVLIESYPKPVKPAKKLATKTATPKPKPATVAPTPPLVVAAPAVAVVEPVIHETPEVASNELLVSDVDFFGGRSRQTTSPATEAPVPKADPRSLDEIIAAVEIGTVTPDEMPSDSELTEEDEMIAAEFDKLVAENSKIEQTSGKVVVAGKGKPAKVEDTLKRVVVTYVRPKDKTVHSAESIIGKTSAKGIPVYLVRSHQPNATWWVQETAVKQGIYFRATALFGNTHTPDGAAFDFVIAFVPKVDDIPELGSELIALPPDWTYSPEMQFTLKRN